MNSSPLARPGPAGDSRLIFKDNSRKSGAGALRRPDAGARRRLFIVAQSETLRYACRVVTRQTGTRGDPAHRLHSQMACEKRSMLSRHAR